jgi:hypothetical protein
MLNFQRYKVMTLLSKDTRILIGETLENTNTFAQIFVNTLFDDFDYIRHQPTQ